MTQGSNDRPVAPLPTYVFWALMALSLVVLFCVLPHSVEGDGRMRLNALESWLAGNGIPGTKYPLIGSIPAMPLILLGHVIGSTEWWVSRYNVIVYAAGLGYIYRSLHKRIAGDVLAAFMLLLAATAMLPNTLTGFGAETFTVMAAGAGLAAWSVGRWKTATVLLGLGVANVPATFVGLVLAMAWWAWREKRVRALAPLVVGAGLWMLENAVRHKSPFSTGYESDHGFPTVLPYSGLPGFSYPTFFGVLSLLFSFGKGILFFAPGLVLAFRRGLEELKSVQDVLVMWLLYLVGLLPVYGSWWAWYGGFTWGPRFLVFASLPAALLLAAQVRRPPRLLLPLSVVIVVAILSVWVGIDGMAYGPFAQDVCSANHYALESFCWYVPEFSVLWTPFVFHASTSLRDAVLILYAAGVSIYVAYPLIVEWWVTLQRDTRAAWKSYRGRATWRL